VIEKSQVQIAVKPKWQPWQIVQLKNTFASIALLKSRLYGNRRYENVIIKRVILHMTVKA